MLDVARVRRGGLRFLLWLVPACRHRFHQGSLSLERERERQSEKGLGSVNARRKALKLIACGKLTFDQRVVLHRVAVAVRLLVRTRGANQLERTNRGEYL